MCDTTEWAPGLVKRTAPRVGPPLVRVMWRTAIPTRCPAFAGTVDKCGTRMFSRVTSDVVACVDSARPEMGSGCSQTSMARTRQTTESRRRVGIFRMESSQRLTHLYTRQSAPATFTGEASIKAPFGPAKLELRNGVLRLAHQ